jgi:hypothetical protein
MSRNMTAGLAKLTDAERAQVHAERDGTPDGEDRAFEAQLRIARTKIKPTRDARRERGRER